MDYTFPSGVAHVEIIPETAKLDVNKVLPEELYRLVVALGIEPERAQEITLGIVDWRSPLSQEASAVDQYYLSLTPSFRGRHASIEEIEELLLVKGVTPDIFYGTYVPVPDAELGGGPRLAPRAGLADCLSVFGSTQQVDANTAAPAVLAAIGLAPFAIEALVERRRSRAFYAAATRRLPAIRRRRLEPPAGGRQLHRHRARHGAVAAGQRTTLGPQAHGRRRR